MKEAGRATVSKEFAGGSRGQYAICLPAVLGVQAAEKPPRYVPVAKVRAAMKSRHDRERGRAAPGRRPPSSTVCAMTKPQAAGQAEMLEGSPEEIASKLVDLLSARGLV